MSDTKFTPGPWSERAVAAALRAAHKHDGSWIDELGDGENMPDETDAGFIAAAPELYEALERIYGRLLMSERDGDAHITEEDGAMAEAALRKARGHEPHG